MTRSADAIVTGPAERIYPASLLQKLPVPAASGQRRCPSFANDRGESGMKRWTKRLGLGVVILVRLGAGVAYLMLRASLPQTIGNLALPGLERPVRVIRDAHGIPTIQATSRHDLYMAL